ncbi:uncharacterized protein METZ01_LOCUS346597 [marine metagenome]|uniref:Uncharacterized protein n=1 Tax=marine metagenome TaxID=408172 RepID=A0A382R7N0_9ZZZZ
MTFNLDIIGVWLLVLMTLCILSYLYGDNPFYKIAEHIFVGVSAGYIFALTWWDQIWPNLFGRLFPSYVDAGFDFSPSYIIPLILGIFMLFRLIPSLSWLARFPIAYIVGMAAGLKVYVYINSNILMQIQNSAIDFSKSGGEIFNHILVLLGVISALVYFFFSKEHKGTVGVISKIGIYFLMIKFGASFGFAVMGRISLLIGRFEDLINYSSQQYNYATPIILITMIVSLGIWSFQNNKAEKNN